MDFDYEATGLVAASLAAASASAVAGPFSGLTHTILMAKTQIAVVGGIVMATALSTVTIRQYQTISSKQASGGGFVEISVVGVLVPSRGLGQHRPKEKDRCRGYYHYRKPFDSQVLAGRGGI